MSDYLGASQNSLYNLLHDPHGQHVRAENQFQVPDPANHAADAQRQAVVERAGQRLDQDNSRMNVDDLGAPAGPAIPQAPWSAQVPPRDTAPLAALPLTVPEHLRGIVEAARNYAKVLLDRRLAAKALCLKAQKPALGTFGSFAIKGVTLDKATVDAFQLACHERLYGLISTEKANLVEEC